MKNRNEDNEVITINQVFCEVFVAIILHFVLNFYRYSIKQYINYCLTIIKKCEFSFAQQKINKYFF